MQGDVATLQQQMTQVMSENLVLRQALAEESRRRSVQEEALRSLWGEVQHRQSWAEQVSDGQDASFDMSLSKRRMGSPEVQSVLGPLGSKSPREDTGRHSKASSQRAGDSVTYF